MRSTEGRARWSSRTRCGTSVAHRRSRIARRRNLILHAVPCLHRTPAGCRAHGMTGDGSAGMRLRRRALSGPDCAREDRGDDGWSRVSRGAVSRWSGGSEPRMLCKAAVAPFPPGQARQQATRRGSALSHRSGPSLRPDPGVPDGRHRRRRRARFPPSPVLPDRPRALHRFRAREAGGTQNLTHGTAGQGPWRTAYIFAAPRRPGSRVPVLRRPRTLRAGFAGRRRPTRRSGLEMPALPSLRTVRRTAGASPVSRGIEGRPEGGPIPARFLIEPRVQT